MIDITIAVNDSDIQAALVEMESRAEDLSPVMRIIGEYMVRSTEDRFRNEGPAPDGTPWAPLAPGTRAKKRHAKTLTESGGLRGDIHYRLQGDSAVLVGTTGRVSHAAVHQLGARTGPRVIRPRGAKALYWPGAAHPVKSVKHPGAVIPARPFLGVSSEDSRQIVGMINRYIAGR